MKSKHVDKIATALASAMAPSSSSCSGDVTPCNIDLGIIGIGQVKLPLRPAGFAKLIEAASQAPYGKRTETLVDKSVRNTLEVDAQSVSYSNEFAEAIQQAAEQVASELQLSVERLQVDLYKLLIYPKGGFFLPHRDSEKRPGMVATMIVVLPSPFGGGELVVQTQRQRSVYPFEKARTGTAPQFAAFFADCEHEVKKVTSGVRVCLAFNLVLQPEKKERLAKPKSGADPKLLKRVRSWTKNQPGEPIVFALEHQYSQDGLAPSLLKGVDKELHKNIIAVAEELDCCLYFGQVSRHLSESATDGSENFGGRYGGRYGRERYRSWSGNVDDLSIGEVFEDDITLDGWKDASGDTVDFASMRCDENQLISATPIEDWKPTRQDYEGYTGNAGNTLDRWYHKSAIVLWERSRHFEVMLQMGIEFAIRELKRMRENLHECPEDELEQACDDCQRLAEQIIVNWPKRFDGLRPNFPKTDRPALDSFAAELPEFDDPDLVASFLDTLRTRDWTLSLDRFVIDSLQRFGMPVMLLPLRELLATEPAPSDFGARWRKGLADRDASWLLKLAISARKLEHDASDVDSLFAIAVKKLSQHVLQGDANERQTVHNTWQTLVTALVAWDAVGTSARSSQLLESVLDLPRQRPDWFDLRNAQVPAAIALDGFATKQRIAIPEPVRRWAGQVREDLRKLADKPPMPPTDFTRNSEMSCDCECCRQLKTFLRSPTESKTRIAARVDLRTHLQNQIHHYQLDVTWKLIASGSPQSLELTKTEASYNAAAAQFKKDQNIFESLESKRSLFT